MRRERSKLLECLDDEVNKKAKVTVATGTDDSHPPNDNPKSNLLVRSEFYLQPIFIACTTLLHVQIF